jgi:hypothetical protein
VTIEYGAIAPWLDNWAIYRQLWNPGDRLPGRELALVPTNRVLTVQWRDALGVVVLAFNEFQTFCPIKIVDASRGIVEIALTGEGWKYLKQSEAYTCEIIAYGYLYDSFSFETGMPEPHEELLNGVECYGAPREIIELIGRIPGAVVEMGVDLSGGWSRNPQGYWVREVPKTLQMFGLWFDDLHAKQVRYADLALGCYRQWARVSGAEVDTIYYKGPEILDSLSEPVYVETGHNRYVLRAIQEATKEIERKTGQFFSLKRIYREVHRGKYHQQQLVTRVRPAHIDRYFRLDCFTYSRDILRRYTELEISRKNQALHVDGESGIITMTQSFWDWTDWGYEMGGMGGIRGLSYFPAGENNLEITYTAGYKYVPTDISEAAGNLSAIRQAIFWQQNLSQGMSGISIGCVNMNFNDMFQKWIPGWQQGADSICDNYRHLEIEAF